MFILFILLPKMFYRSEGGTQLKKGLRGDLIYDPLAYTADSELSFCLSCFRNVGTAGRMR